ncbi:hypothetical protein C8Q74DRAFT_755667 [Fomes fomentarius]|nr:hypothetical protein C8Q74DRAFT_755667 [Fomes fomentarius]
MILSLRRLLMKPCNAHLSSYWGGFSALLDAVVTVPTKGEIDISARLAIYVTQTLIGDGYMIYRLWIVWNKSRRVLIIPVLFMLLDAGASKQLWLWHSIYAYTLVEPVVTLPRSLHSSGLLLWDASGCPSARTCLPRDSSFGAS